MQARDIHEQTAASAKPPLMEGRMFRCEARAFSETGYIEREFAGTIEAVKGGGFYGKTLIFDTFVVKTTTPDAWHQLWRNLNWGAPVFPPAASDLAAQLDHLAASIIHLLIPRLTDGQVVSPASYGYADLGAAGYAQVLERMRGRGVRFDIPGEEQRFQAMRVRLWELGAALGLEHAAQVHPRNPFGKPNLWIGENGGFVWLDVLPAMPHKGFILPAFYFPFHLDVRREFGVTRGYTFNRVHTDRLRAYLETHDVALDNDERAQLNGWLARYDRVYADYQAELNAGLRQMAIDDARRREWISANQSDDLQRSRLSYERFVFGTNTRLMFGALAEFVRETPVYRAFYDPVFQHDIRRFIRESDFRRRKILENSVMRGVQRAYEENLLSESEYQTAWDTLLHNPPVPPDQRKKLVATYMFLQSGYTVIGGVINAVSISIFASAFLMTNPLGRLALWLFVDWVVPPVLRALFTASVSVVTRQNLRAAMVASAMPKVGSFLALPADIGHRFGKSSDTIWHFTKRWLIAKLSKLLRPWGGWNSDLERRLWVLLQMERW